MAFPKASLQAQDADHAAESPEHDMQGQDGPSGEQSPSHLASVPVVAAADVKKPAPEQSAKPKTSGRPTLTRIK
jgi:hypothetical protein